MLGKFIAEYFNKEFIKGLNNKVLILFIICSFLYSLFDFSVLGNTEIYLGTVIGTALLFIFALKNPFVVSDNNIFVKLGAKYSVYIYVSHLIFVSLIEKYFCVNGVLQFILPIIVVFCSILVSFFYFKIKNKIVKN